MTIENETKLKRIVKDGKPKYFKYDGKKIHINNKIINELKKHIENKEDYKKKKEGGVFPLLAAIPAIIAALGEAAGIAGGVATAVNNAKQVKKTNLETEKVNEKLKQLKENKLLKTENSGAGVYLNPYEGRALYDFIKNTRFEKLPFLKNIKDGEGVHLAPYKKEL